MQQDAGFTCNCLRLPDSCLISVLVKALSHLPFQGRPPALAAVLLPASAAAELCPSSRVAAVATKQKQASLPVPTRSSTVKMRAIPHIRWLICFPRSACVWAPSARHKSAVWDDAAQGGVEVMLRLTFSPSSWSLAMLHLSSSCFSCSTASSCTARRCCRAS